MGSPDAYDEWAEETEPDDASADSKDTPFTFGASPDLETGAVTVDLGGGGGDTSVPILFSGGPVGTPTVRFLLTDGGIVTDVGFGVAFDIADANRLPSWATSLYDIYDFYSFYHPYVGTFIEAVRQGGLMGLFAPAWEGTGGLARQDLGNGVETAFFSDYAPSSRVGLEPREEIDFSNEGAYGLYNWELFYFIPLLIAMRLDSDHQFEDAHVWYSTVFDPADKTTELDLGDTPWRMYFKVKPLMEDPGSAVTNWEAFTGADGDDEAAEEFQSQVDAWLDDPFNPHALARIRPGVYQRWTFMRYVEHLLAWGDHLFSRDTMETLNEATQVYMLAKQLLGQRPTLADTPERPTPKCFEELFTRLDAFDNAIVTILNYTPAPSRTRSFAGPSLPSFATLASLVSALDFQSEPYFTVPFNDKLLGYWDTVADRLYKIRNGMNIEGKERQLALFEPPIDPALLVRAAASGIDLGTVLTGLSARRPPYRFAAMLQRAQASVATVKGFGAALAAALEKQDGEALGRLRQEQEVAGIGDQIAQRKLQIEEAKANLRSTGLSLIAARARERYYDGLVRAGLIEAEKLAASLLAQAQNNQEQAEQAQTYATIASLIPQIAIGTASNVEFGGVQLSTLIGFQVAALNNKAGKNRFDAERNRTGADQARRAMEWKFQRDSAAREAKQLEAQIRAAEKRVEVAEGELQNTVNQRERAKTVEEFLTTKSTNTELYDWTVEQLSAAYYQAYRLAFDAAKQAEVCYQYELGRSESFIQYGYWDGSRRGLFAGERLGHDLERLESAHLLNDTREYELTKSISLTELDPASVVLLRENGECYFEIPEAVFDADCPGHYFRRLQGVSVSTLCVGGPHGGVHLRLTLQSTKTRVSTITSGGYAESTTPPDSRFQYDTNINESIVTSQAQQDAGVFSADPKDPRYLPFERRGAISTWRLENIEAIESFDPATLVDVVVHLRYTARDGGGTLASSAEGAVLTGLNASEGGWSSSTTAQVTGLQRAFSCAREFPDEWYAFQQTENETGDQILTLALSSDLLPIGHQGRAITVTGVHFYLVGVSADNWASTDDMKLKLNTSTDLSFTRSSSAWGNLPHAVSTLTALDTATVSFNPSSYVGTGTVPDLVDTTGDTDRLRTTQIEDMIVLVTYTIA